MTARYAPVLVVTGGGSLVAALDLLAHASIGDEACYRAMDWLLQAEPTLAEEVFHATAHLLNLEVDLLFFDTTSTYFETEDADEPVGRDERGRVTDDTQPAGQAGFRSFGKSKDRRDDLPQVIVGMAVTRDGIPVRCWSWPGNTADSALIRQVKTDIQAWRLARVVWVADRGFASAANRRFLQQGDGHYILCEKLLGGTQPPTPPCPGKAATAPCGTTCGSRSSASTPTSPTTGSSSATIRPKPSATPTVGSGTSPR
ncbi:hypothetical protein [Dactylosporangium sp. NPDC050588]|uniref:IS1634 family transposase n=1 Tax=Dactylosporangium sp. NPDC050588 TaxID=3157211 RepID=UPI0033C8BDEF